MWESIIISVNSHALTLCRSLASYISVSQCPSTQIPVLAVLQYFHSFQHDHAKNNPFLSSPTSEAAPAIPTNNGDPSQIIDLFGASQTDAGAGSMVGH